MKGMQEFGAICKIAGTVLLSQDLVYGKGSPSRGSRGGKQTTRSGTKTGDKNMLDNVIPSGKLEIAYFLLNLS